MRFLGDLVREMTKGSNTALSALSENTGSVIVSLGWSSPGGDGDADVSVLLLGPDGKDRLSLLKGMDSTRGNTESGFIRSVDDAVHRFCTTVVVHLDQPLPRRAAQKEPV
jgi:hypothetical protein